MGEDGIEVRILNERVITTAPKLGVEARTIALTFVSPGLPPLTVWIPEEEDTPEARAAAIRAKIQAATSTTTKTLKV